MRQRELETNQFYNVCRGVLYGPSESIRKYCFVIIDNDLFEKNELNENFRCVDVVNERSIM